MSFSRSLASPRLVGIAPRAANRSTWKIRRARRPGWSSTYCSGVFETMPPSQENSPSISIGGKPGGSAPLAMMWRTSIGISVLSK